IGDPAAVRATLERLRPDVVVNTAAFHNVPRCEAEEERAFALNAVAARRLAQACSALNARLVHVSTDYVFDGAKQAPYVETEGPPGLFHATNQGSCSWYEFARAIFDLARLETPLLPTTVKEFRSPVRRPFYSVLENAALRAAGLDRMRPWRDALASYLQCRLA